MNGSAMMMTIASACCLALLIFSRSAEGTLRVQAYLPRLIQQPDPPDAAPRDMPPQELLESMCLDTRKSWGTGGLIPAVDGTEGGFLGTSSIAAAVLGRAWHIDGAVIQCSALLI